MLRHKEVEELALGQAVSSRARVFTAFLGCLTGVLRRWLSLASSAEPRGVAASSEQVRCADLQWPLQEEVTGEGAIHQDQGPVLEPGTSASLIEGHRF